VIVDTSALVALAFREPGYQDLIAKLAGAPSAGIGAPALAETGLVLAARLGRDSRDLIIRLLDEFSIEEIPFGGRHWREAVDAYLRFGKGRHTARLNFGDCLTYAVARLANEPLLFVGDDFAETDLEPA
jgi:ribonuclease VapC